MKVLLVTPPMTQLNTPYPATAYLTGFLRSQGVESDQVDLSLELALKLFSHSGLQKIKELLEKTSFHPPSVEGFLENFEIYLSTVVPTVSFLQGKNSSLAYRIVSRSYLPEGERFKEVRDLDWAFGRLGIQDCAKYLASLYIDDLSDVIRHGIDSRFELSRYGEKLAASQPDFGVLKKSLEDKPTLIDEILDELVEEMLLKFKPELVGLSVPFPGNVYGAFRIAKKIKEILPQIKTVLGGGYVNTELRTLSDHRVFDFMDFICLDDGEKPFLALVEYLRGLRTPAQLVRTFYREGGKVFFQSHRGEKDFSHKETGTPSYNGLFLDSYLSLFEMLNPMHRIWSDQRWNKLTLAHGCYWRKCTFCDLSLDYIGHYDPSDVETTVGRIQALIKETGETGFHFVDEAMPPALLKALAKKLIEKKIEISWWGNIRFEKTFDQELTDLMAQSGCIAVSGGLEVASDRILALIKKGVSLEQVAKVTSNFSQSGILVHAYLMYGFPTQSTQESIDALEVVRQLFLAGCIQSGFWHRFSVTAHSPIGREPQKFGIELLPMPVSTFAKNDLPFFDPTPCDHEKIGRGLNKALFNYMHGVGLEKDVQVWFAGD